ncbi:MAG: AAA family ATPase [Candidatus Jorgensenbacteria bacterium]
MIDAKFTVKNYRCFSDEHPLELVLRDGFTAFIGPNNSGKSFVLKFFYEFRAIWNFLLNQDNLNRLLGGVTFGVDFTGIVDKEEVFYKFSKRNIQIELRIGEIKLSFAISKRDASNANIGDFKISIKDQEVPIGNASVSFSSKVLNYSGPTFSGQADISYLLNLLNALAKCIYIPSFRNAINIGAEGKYFDISVGSAFIDTWHQWKVGPYAWQSQKIQDITEHIRKLFGYSSLEINASPQLKTLKLVINGQVYKLPEVGSGITHFVLVLASVGLASPSFILIDEPEENLHSALQQKFLMSLASYCEEGVLFATHSLGLARSMGDRIYSVTKDGNSSVVRLLEWTPNYAELLGELGFSAYQELGVEKILLVEGPTEVKTFQQFLRKKGKDKDFVILPLGGDGMINGRRAQELAEIKRITPKIFCWIDSEKNSKTASLPRNRISFLSICERLKIKVHASELRAIENYFPERAVKKIKGEGCPLLAPYAVLDSTVQWVKEENWRIAQETNFDEIKDTDLGRFIMSI